MEIRGQSRSIANRTRTLVLASNGDASDVFRSGTLTEGKLGASAAMDAWTYDPLDTRPGGAESAEDDNR